MPKRHPIATAIAAGLAGSAQATIINVDGGCSLADAIASSNQDTSVGTCEAGSGADEIVLPADQTITLSAQLPFIEDTVTVTGNNATISGNDAYRIFEGRAALTVNNATLTAGAAGEGGAVRMLFPSPLVLNNVTISNSTATGQGGAVMIGGNGTLEATSCTFQDNSAPTGGAIYVSGSPYVKSVAASGKGVDRHLTIRDSTLTGNSASQVGGAVAGVSSSYSFLRYSTINNNTAVTAGGALHFDNSRVLVQGGSVDSNITSGAGSRGGGIYSGNNALVQVNNASVSTNQAAEGGAVSVDASYLLLGNVTLSGNTATTGAGGAVSTRGTDNFTQVEDVRIRLSTLANNTAYTHGGALYSNSAVALVDRTEITANRLQENSAFGAGIWSNGQLTVSGSTIANNYSPYGGGAIFAQPATPDYDVQISNSTISGNTTAAGAAFLGSNTHFSDVTFAFNYAYAGAHHVNVATATFNRVLIVGDGTDSPAQPDCYTAETTQASYVISNDPTAFSCDSDLEDADGQDDVTIITDGSLNLGALADNGGPTRTHALLAGSSAIDAGGTGCSGEDQRGETVPVDGDGVGGAECDVGAFEQELLQAGVENTFTVNTTDDNGDGFCGSVVGECTLRDAIVTANDDGAPSFVAFDAGVFNSPQMITLGGTVISITDDLGIQGPGTTLTISGGGQSQIFYHNDGLYGDSPLSVSGLTLTGGSSSSSGGAIESRDSLSVDNVIVTGNTAALFGGGIAQFFNTFTLTNSVISGNTAVSGGGGGLYLQPATGTILNTELSGNFAPRGGGANIRANGPFAMTNVTVSGNTASSTVGGGLYLGSGDFDLDQITILDNYADSGGGGFHVNTFNASGSIANSIVAQNIDASFSNPDLTDGLTVSNTLIGSNQGTSLTEAPVGSQDGDGNLIGDPNGSGVIDPVLGSLADNGGNTASHLPLPGSPVVDQFTGCTVTPDQRGATRPVNADGLFGNDCDMGAVEVQNTPVMPVTDTNLTNQDTTAAGNVLANDTDAADEDTGILALTAVNGNPANIDMLVTGSEAGAFTVASDGGYTFDPLAAFVDLDDGESRDTLVNYTVSDGFAELDAQLRITVTGLNDPLSITEITGASTDEDTSVTAPYANIVEPDLTEDINYTFEQPARGTITDNGDNTFTFDPNGEFETLAVGAFENVSIPYTAADEASSDSSEISIFVNGVNDPPVAGPDALVTGINQTLQINETCCGFLLENDSDIDGDPLSVDAGMLTVGGIGGTAEISGSNFTFTPPADTTGDALVEYTLRDSNDATDTGIITVTVVPADNAEMSISKDNGQDVVFSGGQVSYTIAVTNDGPADVAGALVEDTLPSQLVDAQWTCSAGTGAFCNVSGAGDISETVDIPAGQSVTFTLTATVVLNEGDQVSNTATVTPPAGVPETFTADNSATDTDTDDGVFSDGFETPMVMANFAKRIARVQTSRINPPADGGPPVLIGRAFDRSGDGIALFFARRHGQAVEVRIGLYEGGTWRMGDWHRTTGELLEFQW